MIYHLAVTTSTNDEAKSASYRDGDIVWADFQTAGRGQRGHQWESRAGENLTFTVVLEPHFLPVTEQFLLSETVALSLVDLLSMYGIDARIKWTNDIYVGDKKIVGILIEHIYSGSALSRTMVGIGVNVNQREFSPLLPNPISMALLTGKQFETEDVLRNFESVLQKNYAMLRAGEKDAIQSRYNSLLYRRDEPHIFALPDGTRFTGIIRGVKPMGDLLVEDEKGVVKGYLFKEIEFVIG